MVKYPIQAKMMPFRQGDAAKNWGKCWFYLLAKTHSSHSAQWSETSDPWLL